MDRREANIDAPTPYLSEGEMARRVRAFDWSSTPLGPIEAWPEPLRTVVATMLDSRIAMMIWWGPGLVNLYNDAYAPMLGKKHPAALGRSGRDVWSEIWADIEPKVRGVFERGETTFDERLRLVVERNGVPEDAWFTFGYSPLPDGRGGVGGLLNVVIEETARVRAERRSADVLASITDGLITLDRDFRFAYVNPAAERLVGMSAGELIGRSHWETFPATVGTRLEREYRRAVAERVAVEVEIYYGPWDRWFDARAFPTEAGGLSVYFRDVTERKRDQGRAEAILEGITDGFFAFDREWKFTYVNAAAERLVERSRAELIGKDFFAEFPGVLNTPYEALYRRAHGDRVGGSLMEYYPDHGRWYEVHVYPAGAVGGGEGGGGVAVYFRDVSDRVLAERELGRAGRRHRLALDSADLGAWTIDPATFALDGDARFNEIFHGDPAPMTYEEALARIHDDDRAGVRAAVAAAIDPLDPRPYEHEYRVVHPDGTVRHVFARGKANFVGDGPARRMESFDGTITDVTEKRRAAAAVDDAHGRVAETARQMELVVRGANVGVWYCPLPFDVLHWDDKVKEHFHLAPTDAVTIDTFYDRIHPDDRDRTRDAIGRAIDAREAYEVDYRTVSPDGTNTNWVRAIGRAFYDERTGEPVRFDGVTIDVSARKAAEDALRESEARFRNMADTAPAMLWITEPDGMCSFLSRGWYAFTGQTVEEGLGLGWTNAAHPDDRAAAGEAFLAANRDGAHFEVDYRLRRADGEYRWVLDAGRPRFAADGAFQGFIGSVIDITDRKRAEEQRQSLLDAERAARVEADLAGRMKDEFLATLSHELRTPLNAILGWSQILKRAPGSAADVAQGVDVIERNARAQAQIIEDLLDMSRIISGKIRLDVRPLDLADLVRVGIDAVRPAAEAKGIRLQSTLDPPGAGTVGGDAGRIGQVLWNLLTNAIKFTPTGGRVSVELRRVASHVELVVADTGEGIAAEFLPFVFDRFRQADASTTRRFGGLGLGLSIVKQLVELHGGSVRVASDGPGRGSSFVVSLPIGATRAAGEDDGPAPATTPPSTSPSSRAPHADDLPDLAGLSVLVVDDEADARALVRRLLEDRAARVTTAATADEAVALAAGGARFDVIVSDVGMPGEDGLTMIRRLRAGGAAANGDVPAVALTAYARAEDRVRAIRAGFQMHVAKPVEPAELIATVASLARRIRA